MSVTVEIFSSFEDAESIAEEWDSFMESIDAEIYLCYTWLKIWWKYFGNRGCLKIFVFREQGQIIGIVPLVKVTTGRSPFKIKTIRLAGSGTDYWPATNVVPIEVMSLKKVVPLLHREVMKWRPWDLLHFGEISGVWHEHVDEFVRIYKSSFFLGKIRKKIPNVHNWKNPSPNVQIYYDIPPTWEEYLLKMHSHSRQRIKRVIKKLKQQGLEIISTDANAQTLPLMFDTLVHMHQKYWQSENEPGHFAAPDSYAFHYEVASELLRENRLRLYQLKINDEFLCISYGYKFGRTYYPFLFARNMVEGKYKYPFAQIWFYDMVQKANKEGVVRFDFMRGYFDYKMLLGGYLLPIQNINISKRISPKLILFRFLFIIWHNRYFKICRKGIAPGMKEGHSPDLAGTF